MVVERVVINGGIKFNNRLRAIRRTSDMRPFWNIAKSIVWRNTARRFREQGGSKGKWAPLSTATPLLRRSSRGGKISTLQDSGMLLKSVTTQQSIKEMSKHQLIIGTNLKYASVQQNGATIKVTPSMRGFYVAKGNIHLKKTEIKIPGRPFLYIDQKDKSDLGRGLKFYFNGVISGKGALAYGTSNR